MNTSWDYIIIGAGSSGCAAAAALVEASPKKKVLVIEAGPSDASLSVKIPAGQRKAIASYSWQYSTEPDPSRCGKVERWSRGRVLGGSSSINGTVYVRGAAADYDRWNASLDGWNGLKWSSEEVMKVFEQIESSDQSNSSRGHAGSLHVRTIRHPHELTRAFVASAQNRGYPFNEDFNASSQEGVAYAQLSQRRGLRWSSADAFLKPLVKRSNIQLMLNAQVQRISMIDGRADAVLVLQDGQLREERARHVILSAGAIETPKLLMLSGIGDQGELSRHGISTELNLPGVGRNLREHPLLGMIFRTRIPSFNQTGGIRQKLGVLIDYVRHREGPIANLFESVAFIRSEASKKSPDLQVHFLVLGYEYDLNGGVKFASYPSVTVLINKSHPKSSGRISLNSADPAQPPAIECRLLDEQVDLESLVDGICRVREIMGSDPIAQLIEQEVYPGKQIETKADLSDYVRRNTGPAYHPVGTCKMGIDDLAVVSPDLKVRGSENLWIADASIMPDLISGNTNAACMMIGRRLGMHLSTLS